MENEEIAVQGDAGRLVSLYGRFAQDCERTRLAMDRFIAALKTGAEFPPRSAWPDMLLEPEVNEASGRIAEEGRLLARFRVGELPAEVVQAGDRYIKSEDELVNKVEQLAMMPCLLETRRADHALWNYMKGETEDPAEIQRAKVQEMVAEKLRCYRKNAMEIYGFLAGVRPGSVRLEATGEKGSQAERRLKQIEGKVDSMVQPCHKYFWHDWPNRKRIKMRQLEAVLAYVQGKENIKPEDLHVACVKVYQDKNMEKMVAYGGYPSGYSLYQICHRHIYEFFRGK